MQRYWKLFSLILVMGAVLVLSGCIFRNVLGPRGPDNTIYIRNANDIFSVTPEQVCLNEGIYVKNDTDKDLLITLKEIFETDTNVSFRAGEMKGPYRNNLVALTAIPFSITVDGTIVHRGRMSLRCNLE